jgi:hypothetical protein
MSLEDVVLPARGPVRVEDTPHVLADAAARCLRADRAVVES